MADILHRIGVEQSSPQQVYDALTALDGLSGWWTEKTSGETGLGGVIEFRFGPGGFDMKGLREPVEFMNHCSTKWATYLMSLKQFLETGKGAPDPHDVKISDWH